MSFTKNFKTIYQNLVSLFLAEVTARNKLNKLEMN